MLSPADSAYLMKFWKTMAALDLAYFLVEPEPLCTRGISSEEKNLNRGLAGSRGNRGSHRVARDHPDAVRCLDEVAARLIVVDKIQVNRDVRTRLPGLNEERDVR